jgi:branched-subunit amino acid aminotransferase/4-amino-4-deoxychorismate lyase
MRAEMQEKFGILSFDEVVDRLLLMRKPYHQNYLAMYSSWYGGIITDPALMMVPVDDHLVHRGDGVFEAFKCVDWKLYGLNRHLDRMDYSAKMACHSLPFSRPQLVETILATVRAANLPDCSIRMFLSRGPGGFSASPYECPESQLYIVVTTLLVPGPEKYDRGVSLRSSLIPLKRDYFANIKSCNYLPNVLMRKEAEDAGVDFTVSIDEQGFLAEGPTENIGIITRNREFLVPRFDRILRGTTVSRAMELAEPLLDAGELVKMGETDLTPEDAYSAAEMMMFGTSFDVLPVVNYDGYRIGDGQPGFFARRFRELLREDMRSCTEMTTPVRGVPHE